MFYFFSLLFVLFFCFTWNIVTHRCEGLSEWTNESFSGLANLIMPNGISRKTNLQNEKNGDANYVYAEGRFKLTHIHKRTKMYRTLNRRQIDFLSYSRCYCRVWLQVAFTFPYGRTLHSVFLSLNTPKITHTYAPFSILYGIWPINK